MTDHKPLTLLMDQQVLSLVSNKVDSAWIVPIYPA